MQVEDNKELKPGFYETSVGVHGLLDSMPMNKTNYYKMFSLEDYEIRYVDIIQIERKMEDEEVKTYFEAIKPVEVVVGNEVIVNVKPKFVNKFFNFFKRLFKTEAS